MHRRAGRRLHHRLDTGVDRGDRNRLLPRRNRPGARRWARGRRVRAHRRRVPDLFQRERRLLRRHRRRCRRPSTRRRGHVDRDPDHPARAQRSNAGQETPRAQGRERRGCAAGHRPLGPSRNHVADRLVAVPLSRRLHHGGGNQEEPAGGRHGRRHLRRTCRLGGLRRHRLTRVHGLPERPPPVPTNQPVWDAERGAYVHRDPTGRVQIYDNATGQWHDG